MEDNRNPRFINWFAIIVAVATISTLCWLIFMASSIVTMQAADSDKRFEHFNAMFTAILPVIATWMGTLLAYYFTKENFMAASQAQRDLIDKFTTSEQKLQSIKVSQVMIPLHDMKVQVWPESQNEAVSLTDFLRFFNENKISRMPITDGNDHLRYIVHESTFNEFIVRFIKDTAKPLADITVQDFFDSLQTPAYQDLGEYVFKGAEFIAYGCNLKDAQQKMEKNRNCQDVFVTPNGDAKEKLLGWVPNRVVEENVRL